MPVRFEGKGSIQVQIAFKEECDMRPITEGIRLMNEFMNFIILMLYVVLRLIVIRLGNFQIGHLRLGNRICGAEISHQTAIGAQGVGLISMTEGLFSFRMPSSHIQEAIMEQTFGQALQELRRSAGISQRDLAARVGVDFSYISKVENDRLPPPAADTIVKICEELKAPPDELLALTKKMPSDVKEKLSSSPAAQQFIRQAQSMNLTDREWQSLTRSMKRLRGR